MNKIWKSASICILLTIFVWFASVLTDRKALTEDIIRLHVVANSDSDEDQAIKLQVKDAVVAKLESTMQSFSSVDEAKAYLQAQQQNLEMVANNVLEELGSNDKASVFLTQECFDTREYETFSLPAGVYESLRITIGQGQGRNWWCVVFPTLCAGATTEEFADTAVGSGFDNALTGALEREKTYQVRFFFLDCLGRIQNFFYKS